MRPPTRSRHQRFSLHPSLIVLRYDGSWLRNPLLHVNGRFPRKIVLGDPKELGPACSAYEVIAANDQPRTPGPRIPELRGPPSSSLAHGQDFPAGRWLDGKIPDQGEGGELLVRLKPSSNLGSMLSMASWRRGITRESPRRPPGEVAVPGPALPMLPASDSAFATRSSMIRSSCDTVFYKSAMLVSGTKAPDYILSQRYSHFASCASRLGSHGPRSVR
jgi:hypothetical protein